MNNQHTTNTNSVPNITKNEPNDKISWGIVGFIIIVIVVCVVWYLSSEKPNHPTEVTVAITDVVSVDSLSTEIDSTNQTAEEASDSLTVIALEQEVIEASIDSTSQLSQVPEEPVVNLPALDDSDTLVTSKLPELTLKTELLTLFITEDIIRRFVVFTDNFTRGSVAYEHSLFIPPNTSFFANESFDKETKQTTIEWNKASSERFSLYVDLFRSLKTKELVSFYAHVKPLIDQAYQEIGYEKSFTDTLQLAIQQVLNAKMPEGVYELSRTSVMFTYKNDEIESLSDAQKILLRIGQDNIILMKSVLLDINGQLSKLNS